MGKHTYIYIYIYIYSLRSRIVRPRIDLIAKNKHAHDSVLRLIDLMGCVLLTSRVASYWPLLVTYVICGEFGIIHLDTSKSTYVRRCSFARGAMGKHT